jgi:hypothetical protein
LEREKGFEPTAPPVFSRTYLTIDDDGRSSTEPADASGRVATSLHAGDEEGAALPAPTPDLFIAAGVAAGDRANQDGWDRPRVEALLLRAVDQAAALRGVAA